MTTEHKDPGQDKIFIALMTSLTSLTALLRFASGENYIDKDEAMGIAAKAIRSITESLDEFNL